MVNGTHGSSRIAWYISYDLIDHYHTCTVVAWSCKRTLFARSGMINCSRHLFQAIVITIVKGFQSHGNSWQITLCVWGWMVMWCCSVVSCTFLSVNPMWWPRLYTVWLQETSCHMVWVLLTFAILFLIPSPFSILMLCKISMHWKYPSQKQIRKAEPKQDTMYCAPTN